MVAGVEFALPPELSLDALNCFGALAAGDPAALDLGLEAMFNGGLGVLGEVEEEDDGEGGRRPKVGPDGESFVRLPTAYEHLKEVAGGLSVDDAEWLIDEVCDQYGMELPKSSGSADSSGDTSPPSRPTSDASTG